MFTHLILRGVKGDRGHEDIPLEDGKTYTLGRARDCDIRLCSPDVSRHHCQLVVHAPAVYLRDLGSRNGTLLNGKVVGQCDGDVAPPAKESQEQVVGDGDVLRIGDNLFWLDCTELREAEVTRAG
jgi:pSer/pThr/pTyr-binding forkhead associated (FHA) protein